MKKQRKMDFFTQEEVSFLNTWGGQTYDMNSQEHIAAKNYIMNSLGTKTQYWSNELVQLLPGLETFNWRMWSQPGKEGKKSVSKFKTYTWARIYRKGDRKKHIFFTVGADGSTNELVFKLDFYFQQSSTLSKEQQEIIKKNIPKELEWSSISSSEFVNYDWDKLLKITSSFIATNLSVYDKLISLAWGDSKPEDIFRDTLRKRNKPKNLLSKLPEISPSFKGIEKDFIGKAIEKKELGDLGEKLVLEYEKEKLTALGFVELAEKVNKVQDGMGYDILSFDENQVPIFIEVKTTTKDESTPFGYTLNEMEFAKQNIGKYYIFRIYNYDFETNTADFFPIENPLDELLFQPTQFKVYLKK